MRPYLILVLLFAAQTEQKVTPVTVQEGCDAVLSCDGLMDRGECRRTTWALTGRTVEAQLVKFGQICENEISKAKSERMSVAENCSLVIRRVTADDVGLYTCNQSSSSGQEPTHMELSVVKITEHKDSEQVTLSCDILMYEQCKHQVKWLYRGQAIDEHPNLKMTLSNCSANVTFSKSYSIISKPSDYHILRCEVTGNFTTLQFTFRSLASGERKQTPGNDDAAGKPSSGWWWLYIIVAVGVAALLTAAVLLVRRRKTTGRKPQMDKNMTDPEESVSYSSIIHPKTSDKTQVRGRDHAVTYSTVKAGASSDPSSLYATID